VGRYGSLSGFKKGKLAHTAGSVPLLSVQHPDSAVSLNPDSSRWIRIPDQDLRRENWHIMLGQCTGSRFSCAIKSGC
jgi:hypothetical protein